jgi:putative colanic acid biosynthesis glycosyltransferase
MKQARFTVITIVLNDLPGLRETTNSVKAQAFSDFEWLIVDGGSKDGTVEYLKQLDHPNCRWASEQDKGLFDAMNKGLARATGQYVIFMNSGDRFADGEVLNRVDASLRQDGQYPDLIFGDAYEETAGGDLLLKPARPARAINRGMFTHHQAMFYARNAVGDMRYDCKFRMAADYHFTSRLLASGARSLYVGFPICIFERAGFSEQNAAIGRRENLAVQKDVLRLGPARRIYNHASFLASAFLRTYMRGFYDRLRYRPAAPIV